MAGLHSISVKIMRRISGGNLKFVEFGVIVTTTPS
jgi:hypothetical protein